MELPVREEEGDDVLRKLRRKAKKQTKSFDSDVDLGRFSKSHVVTPDGDAVESEEYGTAYARHAIRTMRYTSAPSVDRTALSNEDAQRKVLERMKQYSSRRKRYSSRHRPSGRSDSRRAAPKNTEINTKHTGPSADRKQSRRHSSEGQRWSKHSDAGQARRRHAHEPHHETPHETFNGSFGSGFTAPSLSPPPRRGPSVDFNASCPSFNTPSMGMLVTGCKPRTPPIEDRRRRSTLNSRFDKPRERPPRVQQIAEEYEEDDSIGSLDVPSIIFANHRGASDGMSVVSELEFEPYSQRKADRNATKIQSFWRMVMAREMFRTYIDAAITIQAMVRETIEHRLYMQDLERNPLSLEWYAATVIQSGARGMFERIRLRDHNRAASFIQTVWRIRQSRQGSLDVKRASVVALLGQHATKESCSIGSSSPSTGTTETTKTNLSWSTTDGETDLHNHAFFLPSRAAPARSGSKDDLDGNIKETHYKLEFFELGRQKTYEPKLLSSCSHWHSSVDTLQACVREMAKAEGLVFESLAEKEELFNAANAGNEKDTSIWGLKKQKDPQHELSNGFDACMDIAREVSAVHEELQTHVNEMCESGDAIVAELGSSEMAVVQAWDAYVSAAKEASGRGPDYCIPSSDTEPRVFEAFTDVWLMEMRYRVAVSFQNVTWKKAVADLSQIFGSVKKIKQKHRVRLRTLLNAFTSQETEQEPRATSATNEQDDKIQKKIQELIQELTDHTERRPPLMKEFSCLDFGKRNTTMLESPMCSKLVNKSKVIEHGTKGAVGLRTYWDRSLVVLTVDGFVHLFHPLPSSEEVNDPEGVFLDLVRGSQDQNENSESGGLKHVAPTESLFLPNCVVNASSKEVKNFSVKEDQLGKHRKVSTRRFMLRTESAEETNEWVRALHGTPGPASFSQQ